MLILVEIYNEPIIDVGQTITQWFGQPSNVAVTDISILFSYLFLFVFVLSIFGLLFKRWK